MKTFKDAMALLPPSPRKQVIYYVPADTGDAIASIIKLCYSPDMRITRMSKTLTIVDTDNYIFHVVRTIRLGDRGLRANLIILGTDLDDYVRHMIAPLISPLVVEEVAVRNKGR